MAYDPLDCMQAIGTATATSLPMRFSLGPLGTRTLLYVTGARNVAPVFLNPGTFRTSNVPLRAMGGGAQARLRRGLIGAQGAEHKHYRAAFAAQVTEMQSDFAGIVGRQVKSVIEKLPHDRPIDIVAFFNDLVRTYSIVGMYNLSADSEALAIGRSITEWIDLAYKPATTFFPLRLPGSSYHRFMKLSDQVEQNILGWVRKIRNSGKNRGLISIFIDEPDENGETLPDNRLVGHVLTLYAASFSSTVAALIWTLLLIMQHPEIARQLAEEIRDSGIDPVSEGLKLDALPLLDSVLKESMRLFTPVPYQVRRLTSHAEIGGHQLKRKDAVVIGSWANNRLEDVFPQAGAFLPQRWQTQAITPFDCLTFSAGPRRCVGFSLAQIMTKTTLASVLLDRSPQLAKSVQIDTRVAVTLRSRQPIPVIMARRNEPFRKVPVTGTVTRLLDSLN